MIEKDKHLQYQSVVDNDSTNIKASQTRKNYQRSKPNESQIYSNDSFIGLVVDSSFQVDKPVDYTDRYENKSICLTNEEMPDSGLLITQNNSTTPTRPSNFSTFLIKSQKDHHQILINHLDGDKIPTENPLSTVDNNNPEMLLKSRKRTVSFGLSVQISNGEEIPRRKLTIPGVGPSFSILKNPSKDTLKQHAENIEIPMENENSDVDTPVNQNLHLSPPNRRRNSGIPYILRHLENRAHARAADATNQDSMPSHLSDENPSYPLRNRERRQITINMESLEQSAQVRLDVSASNQPPPAQNQPQDGPSVEERKEILKKLLGQAANFKIRRAVVLCFSIFIGSILAFPLVDGGSSWLRGIFIVCEIFLGYYLIENIVKFFRKDILPWKKFENFFDILDVANLIIFTVTVDLRLSGIPVITKYASIPPLLSVIVYFWKSKAPKALKEAHTTLRVLLALQILLLTGRADENLMWAWKALMSFLWLYGGLLSIYSLLVGITLISVIALACLRMRLYDNLSLSAQIVGFLWSTLYSGLGAVALVCLVGITLVYDSEREESRSVLTSAMLLGQYLSLAIGIFSISAYHWIYEFLMKFNMDEADYRTQLGLEETNGPQVVTEKKDVYLVMLSSTYFLSLKNSFFLTNKDKLSRLKRAIRESKKKKNKHSKFNDVASKISKRPITVQELIQEKAGLDELVAKGALHDAKGLDAADIKRPRGLSMGFVSIGSQVTKRERKESTVSNGQIWDAKICLSEGDRTIVFDSPEHTYKQKGESEDLCYICYANAPNAVIQECGHGGICADCAIQTIKTKGQCMECRAEVKHVIKIEVDPKMKNIIKGYETLTITPDKPNEENN